MLFFDDRLSLSGWFFFSSRRRHTRWPRDWSSDVCSSDLGRTIVIDHGHQISTLYGHLAKPDVVRGQTVEEGAEIGLIGATGHASGPHLHYEVLVNGRPVNPRLVFTRPQDIYGRSRVAARENPSGQQEARSIPSPTDAAKSWQ